jgi:uridine phosphorylase
LTTSLYLHPTAELAERALLPGDPGRALALAQLLLSEPKMFNHNRGLWGYTGTAPDGAPLTIQSTGIGGPSVAIVITELAELGARRLVRVGTCGSLASSLSLGDLVVVTEAVAEDGASRALGAAERVTGDAALLRALLDAAGADATAGPVVTTDLFYDGDARREQRWAELGAVAAEMGTATLFALGTRRKLCVAALLVVSDLLLAKRVHIDADELASAERHMGETALEALTGAR